MSGYDFLVVGCGMFGASFAQQMTERGKKVLVIEKRAHVGGNCYTENLEEWALSEVGREIYEIFIKGYTRKQWAKEPRDLPAGIIERLPIRLDFDDNYYDDRYQGIPVGGYTKLFERMLEGTEVRLDTDYFLKREYWDSVASMVVYTGKIDEYFDYKFGDLEYRGLRFESKVLSGDYQGNAVINYTQEDVQ